MSADRTPAPRAAILVTGTEVLSGRRRDRNGPWLAERLRELGVQLEQVVIVGDRREEMLAALRFMSGQGYDLIITSGGLGPTADDLTTAVVAEMQGAPLVLDEDLERRIAEIVAPLLKRFPNVDPDALAVGTRKQAEVPRGATVLEPVGTAPGVIVAPADGDGPLVVVLPGPPRELQPMWRAALETGPLRALLARAPTLESRELLLFGIPESEIAETLRAAQASGIDIDRLEITTCLHRAEIEVTTTFPPPAAVVYEALAGFVAARHPQALFSTDGSTVDEQVAELLLESERTIATAESCTGGLLAARLTDLPGSSRYVRGGIVAYANEAKTELAGVPAELIARHGAVSCEVAVALAEGACAALGADVGVGITGVAGPDGGTAEKPVGLVWISVVLADEDGVAPDEGESRAAREEAEHAGEGEPAERALTRSLRLPGSRADVRERATSVAMHMVRILLANARARPARAEATESLRG